MSNCENCGAPANSKYICEYCGTRRLMKASSNIIIKHNRIEDVKGESQGAIYIGEPVGVAVKNCRVIKCP